VQVHDDTNVLVTSLPVWDDFVSDAQVMRVGTAAAALRAL